MRVTAVRCYRGGMLLGAETQLYSFPVCPRCQLTMEREYQSYCDRCGQALDWKGFSKALVILPEVR